MAAYGGPGEPPGSPLAPPGHLVQFSFSALPPFNPQPQKGTPRFAKKSRKASIDLDNEENFFTHSSSPTPTPTVPNSNQHPIPKGGPTKTSFRDTLMGGHSIPLSVLIDDIDNLLHDDSYNPSSNDDDGIPVVHISKEEHRRLCEPWKKALIVKLLDKNLGPSIMEEQFRRIWRPKGPMFMTDLGNFFYVIKLEDDFDFEKVIFGGPWLISNYLTIQHWVPDFDVDTASIYKIAVWVRVTKLSLEFFDKTSLANSYGNG